METQTHRGKAMEQRQTPCGGVQLQAEAAKGGREPPGGGRSMEGSSPTGPRREHSPADP